MYSLSKLSFPQVNNVRFLLGLPDSASKLEEHPWRVKIGGYETDQIIKRQITQVPLKIPTNWRLYWRLYGRDRADLFYSRGPVREGRTDKQLGTPSQRLRAPKPVILYRRNTSIIHRITDPIRLDAMRRCFEKSFFCFMQLVDPLFSVCVARVGQTSFSRSSDFQIQLRISLIFYLRAHPPSPGFSRPYSCIMLISLSLPRCTCCTTEQTSPAPSFFLSGTETQ